MPLDAPLPLGFEIQFGRRVRGGWNDPAPEAVTISYNEHVVDTNQFLCQLRQLDEGEKYTVSLHLNFIMALRRSSCNVWTIRFWAATDSAGTAYPHLTVVCCLVAVPGPCARPQ